VQTGSVSQLVPLKTPLGSDGRKNEGDYSNQSRIKDKKSRGQVVRQRETFNIFTAQISLICLQKFEEPVLYVHVLNAFYIFQTTNIRAQ
jgi:hypothetical protein